MRFTLACPKGLITDQEIEYIVTCGKDGQFAVLKNHVPVVVPIESGYIKIVKEEKEEFFAVSGAIVEFSNEIVNVIAQEAVSGNTKDEAFVNLEAQRLVQKSENQRKLMDFADLEKELALNLKEIKASKL